MLRDQQPPPPFLITKGLEVVQCCRGITKVVSKPFQGKKAHVL